MESDKEVVAHCDARDGSPQTVCCTERAAAISVYLCAIYDASPTEHSSHNYTHYGYILAPATNEEWREVTLYPLLRVNGFPLFRLSVVLALTACAVEYGGRTNQRIFRSSKSAISFTRYLHPLSLRPTPCSPESFYAKFRDHNECWMRTATPVRILRLVAELNRDRENSIDLI